MSPTIYYITVSNGGIEVCSDNFDRALEFSNRCNGPSFIIKTSKTFNALDAKAEVVYQNNKKPIFKYHQ